MRFLLSATEPTILIRMDCKYTDPLAPVAHGIGEIEYKGTIEINPATRTIDIDLMICLFPAFEAYAAIEDHPGVYLVPPRASARNPHPRTAARGEPPHSIAIRRSQFFRLAKR